MALAAVEWTCLHRPDVVGAFIDALFAAHFALGKDLGDGATVDRHAAGASIDPDALCRAFADGSALRDCTGWRRRVPSSGYGRSPVGWSPGAGLGPAAPFPVRGVGGGRDTARPRGRPATSP